MVYDLSLLSQIEVENLNVYLSLQGLDHISLFAAKLRVLPPWMIYLFGSLASKWRVSQLRILL